MPQVEDMPFRACCPENAPDLAPQLVFRGLERDGIQVALDGDVPETASGDADIDPPVKPDSARTRASKML